VYQNSSALGASLGDVGTKPNCVVKTAYPFWSAAEYVLEDFLCAAATFAAAIFVTGAAPSGETFTFIRHGTSNEN
jgi:hypothetical protein